MHKIKFSKSIKFKLIAQFLCLSLIPVIIVGIVTYFNFQRVILHEVNSKLSAVAEIKTSRLELFFERKYRDLEILIGLPELEKLLDKMEEGLGSSNLKLSEYIKTSDYQNLSKDIDSFFENFAKVLHYDDLLISDHEGNILYTVKKRKDFGENFKKGILADSNLSVLGRDILDGKKEFGFAAFKAYLPNDNNPTAFLAHVINDSNGLIHGFVGLSIVADDIDNIMQEHSGMGETGETYIVGKDYLMRSNSRFSKDDILKTKIFTEGTRDIFNRKPIERGDGICINNSYHDYHNKLVLAHNHYLPEVDWAIMAEVDKSEVLAPLYELGRNIALIIFAILVFSICWALYAASKISGPIINLSTVTDIISQGKLNQEITVTTDDEIGVLSDSFSKMVEGLNTILVKIKDAVNEIGSSSAEILAANQQQAASAREQSSAVSETTSAATELTKSAEMVGENVSTVTQSANHSLLGMGKIKEALEKTNVIVISLNEKSQKIGKITELIDDIANQTNLLAVNASIEAARAGEHGKGFTVVADQIQKLADSTANSTKDITAIVEIIQHEITNAIISMEQSNNSVDEEVMLARDTSSRSKEIAMSVNQQINGAKQIADAMVNIDDSMKQIATGAKESQDAARQLAHLADSLKAEVKKFTLKEKR